jgi:hypothetical protein
MTDRLMTLLHGEAETLDIPPAPATEILGAGRRLRNRRTRTIWATAALTLAVVTAGGAAVADSRDDGHTAAPTGTTPPVPFAWAVDDTVYLGADARAVAMPEVAQTLYYTSAGILVRTNKTGFSDGGAPFHFELVNNDGTATKLGVTLGDVVPSTDPTEPYLAWATMSGGKIQVVVHDVSTDRDVATVDVPGTFTWGGWDAPPVALSGDLVYVGNDDETAVVNWRTGASTTTAVLPGSKMPSVSGGRTVNLAGQGGKQATADIVDTATGRDVLDIPVGRFDQVTLAPDGRFAMVASDTQGSSFEVYDVDTGTHVSVQGSAYNVGWTPQDGLFGVQGDQLTLCDATTGDCHATTVPKANGHALVRYGGRIYES